MAENYEMTNETLDQNVETDAPVCKDNESGPSTLLGTALAFGAGALSAFIVQKVGPKIKSKFQERKAIRLAAKQAAAEEKARIKATKEAEQSTGEDASSET